MRFIVARAVVAGVLKTVLINEEDMKDNGYAPADYFIPQAEDVEEVGAVEIEGDLDDIVDACYESQ
jgi:hypothetical protein